MPTIGAMSTRVSIQERVNAADAYGQPVATWTTLRTVWAAVTQLSGTKVFGEPPELTSQVEIRKFPGLTPAHRILIDGVAYNIASLVTDGVFHTLIVNSKEV
jgi:SPP1 family predicted phage head-tail adaptor